MLTSCLPTGTIMTTVPESNIANNCNIFNLVCKTSDQSFRGSLWHGAMRNETGNLLGNIRENTIIKNADNKNNLNFEKFGRKDSINWNHNDPILNWNQKDSNSIHVDPNHIGSNQPIPADLTNIGSIHDSDNICAIEKILQSPVHSTVHASQIFNYGSASDPRSSPHDSSAESVTPRGNAKPHGNPFNPAPTIPSYLD